MAYSDAKKFVNKVMDLPFMGNLYFRPIGVLCCRIMVEDADSLEDVNKVCKNNGYFVEQLDEFFPVAIIIRK
jgi:hypothetical protein